MRKTLLICLFGVTGCGQLPTSPGTVQASRSQPCARISWQALGSTRDINAAISPDHGDARLTKLAYGPGPRPQAASGDIAEIDQPLRSDRSIELSAEIQRQYQQTQVHEIQSWLQSHLTVEVRNCPS